HPPQAGRGGGVGRLAPHLHVASRSVLQLDGAPVLPSGILTLERVPPFQQALICSHQYGVMNDGRRHDKAISRIVGKITEIDCSYCYIASERYFDSAAIKDLFPQGGRGLNRFQAAP